LRIAKKKFDPEHAFRLIKKYDIKNMFMPPTALKLMRTVDKPRERYSLKVRSIGSGGETLGNELLEWGENAFGVKINEFYGQTEANLLIGNCTNVLEIKTGSMGKPMPGRKVAIVNDDGKVLAPGEEGQVGVQGPDPVIFLGYFKNPEATKKKYANGWLLTGDTAVMDKDGYFHFRGRNDDVIKSAGYRIGPGEIENCLLSHTAVSMAAAVGSPDKIRNEIVKAFIVLKQGFRPSEQLAKEIQEHVKSRLASYEYPREVEFINELPMTTTGKIMRKVLREKEYERKKGK